MAERAGSGRREAAWGEVSDWLDDWIAIEPDGTINFSNISEFSSADYAFLVSFAQQVDLKNGRKFNAGLNAKVIHRKAGDFTKAWGFGFDAAIQYQGERWKLGLVARDVTTTFNAWSFNLNEKNGLVDHVVSPGSLITP